MGEVMVEERRGWHIDKTVNLSMIFFLVVQTASIVWWVAKTDARVMQAEASTVAIQSQIGKNIEDQQKEREKTANDITDLKVKVEGISTKIDVLLGQQLSSKSSSKR
jgi:hypothetical protein